MKTTFTTQHNAASTQNGSHAAHNVYSPLRRLTLLVTLLMTFALGARAASYVISYTSDGTTYYLGMNGNNLQAKTTFDITCVWTCLNGNMETTLGNNSRSLRNRNNSSYYLTTSCTRSGSRPYRYTWSSLSVQTTASNIWRSSNGNVYARISSVDNRQASINVQSLTMIDNNTNSSKNVQVTITDISTTSTNPTINGKDVLTATGNYTYTASGAAYQAGGYTNYYFNSENHYYKSDNSAITPKAATLNTTWSISTNEFATINSSGDVTVNSIPTSDVTLTITATVAVTGGTPAAPDGTTLVGTKEITIQGSVPAAPTISVSGTTVTLQTDATGTTSIRYTIDGTDPTATTGTVYNGAFDISGSTNSPVTIKAITVRNGNASSVTTQQAKLTLPEPVITVNAASGTATITRSNSSATIYYTTDGSAPSATNGTSYNGQITGLTPMTTVKAIAICDGWNSSSVASATVTIPSGVSSDGTTVTLFDYEDHNWTYYQQPSNLPSGYPTTHLSSPNPRNVKITYRGGGVSEASDVAISALEGERQNKMVYYKTLEKSVPGMSGDYPYTVISNPFSKRPATGSGNNKTYYGFAGWKVVDGGEYISEHNDNDVLDLDETIHFTDLNNNYTPNCISAEVVFEATWTEATVITGNSAPSFDGGTYETNFWVLTGNNNIGNITVPGNCTVSSRYPDGTANFTSNLTGTITAGGNNAKVEFVNMNSTGNVSAANYTFTMGRGIVNSGDGGELRGCTNSNADCIQTVKVESGKYASLRHFTAGLSNARRCDQLMILGCDYDRAKGDNDKLNITGSMYVAGTTLNLNRTSGSLYVRCHIKSGKFLSSVSIDDNDGAGGTETFYLSVGNSNTQNAGRRYLCMEGGRIAGIAGGMDEASSQSTTNKSFDLRVRGTALIDGPVYGAAEYAGAKGTRTMIFTGGTVKGWIAGGANGTQSDGGKLDGASYVYVGGKTIVDSNPEESAASNIVINRAVGGNVFGAGCGYSTGSNSGQVTLGTNVVVADDAYVERGVYGGGSYGYCTNTQISNIYITGGRVDGAAGGVNGTSYSANIPGGVYGGACQNQGGTVNIYMTGGEVNGGLYGGSNNSGTIANNVSIQINGGQVGTSSKSANIHGGGYGQNTAVSGNVDITLGAEKQATGGVNVFGDVYGGSALGKVNGTAASDSKHTYVTLNKGTINGSIYGGGLGQKNGVNNATSNIAADVYGPVAVKVYGGSVKKVGDNDGSGGVYGANNINGAPQRSVTVDIYGTDPAPAPAENQYALHAVYGGGNQASYNGTPIVTVHNCDNSIEYIYGGGNAAAVAATDVTIWGGNVIGNVFGGGNGTVKAANVNGDATTKIHGGTILNVYGGSNAAGTINGDIKLTINSMKEEGSSDKQPCTMDIGSVYGGGNLADMNGNISVSLGCINHIKELYGGARNANIGTDTQNSNINLAITSGHFDRVFGGNNLGGAIKGSITVNIEETGCNPITIGELYGGGNLAAYSVYGYDAEGNYKESGTKLYNDPVVNILSFSSIGRVFGGGLGNKAVMVGSPTVNINEDVGTNANNTEWPYLGQTISYTDESSVTLPIRNSGAIGAIGTVFGGGNAAPVIGNTQVNIGTTTGKADIRGNVYGGGNQAKVTGKTNVVIGE